MAEPKGRMMRFVQELAVIVLGVLIALAAQAGYERRADRAQEAIFLAELRLDVQQSIEDADTALERSAQLIQELEDFLEILRRPGSLPDTLTAPVPRAVPLPLLMGTLTALLSAGEVDLVRSPRLRREMLIVSSTLGFAVELHRELLASGLALSQEWLEVREVVRVEDGLTDLRIPARSVRARPRVVGLFARHLNLLRNMQQQTLFVREELVELREAIEEAAA